MKTALVCGAGGFIGSHMVKRLKKEGYWVRGVDLKRPEYSETEADHFVVGDLRNPELVSRITFAPNQSDIYSLGVLLWQMVTGSRPYELDTLSTFDIQVKIVNEALPLTKTSWDEIIQKATEKNIEKRYKSCKDINIDDFIKINNQVQPKPKAEVGSFPINRNSQWKYTDQGVSLDQENWKDVVYAKDTNWVFGNGKLGYGQAGLGTELKFGSDAAKKHITTYLRRNFIPKGSEKFDSLVLYILADDGAVLYLNGKEVHRDNLPSTADFTTLANAEKTNNKYQRVVIANNLIDNDTNVIAVELHQAALDGSDIVFDLQLIGKLPYPAIASFPIKKGDNWLFHDQGVDLGSTWTNVNYEDKGWANGPAILGYTDPVSTIVSFGDDNNNKYITNYFRKRFTVKDVTAISDTLKLSIMKDDGAVVYINGKDE